MNNAFSDLGNGLGFTNTEPLVPPPIPSHELNPNSSADVSGGAAAPVAPAGANLASGIGQILLFPGKTIVSQFVGAGDPLDTSHLPITVLLSAAAWYAAYWWFFQRGASHPRSER